MSEDRDWTVALSFAWAAVLFCVAPLLWGGRDGLDGILARLTESETVDDGRSAGPGPSFLGPSAPADEVDDSALPPVQVADATDVRTPAGPGAVHAKQPVEDVCLQPAGGGGCLRWAMDGFYGALSATEAGRAGAPARVSWYGDSVSASDQIPGRVRARLQSLYGDGGPGFIHAAQPHRFMHNTAVIRSNGGHWQTYGVSTVTIADDLYGVGGSTAEAIGAGNKVRLTPKTPSGKISQVEVYYLAQPKGGSADLIVDGDVKAAVDTDAEGKNARFQRLDVTDDAHTVELRVTHGRVRLFGITLERKQGVVVDNFGLVSASAQTMVNNLPEHWRNQLAHRGSDLIVVMLGSNESNWLSAGKRAMADYQALYERVLAPIRAGRPTGTCLVIAPLDQAELRDDKLVARPLIPMMVEAQRKAARAQGCAFWDTFTWMGGKGAAIRWNRRGLMGSDFHHLSPRGSAMIADGLVEALLAGYGQYRSR